MHQPHINNIIHAITRDHTPRPQHYMHTFIKFHAFPSISIYFKQQLTFYIELIHSFPCNITQHNMTQHDIASHNTTHGHNVMHTAKPQHATLHEFHLFHHVTTCTIIQNTTIQHAK